MGAYIHKSCTEDGELRLGHLHVVSRCIDYRTDGRKVDGDREFALASGSYAGWHVAC